jgi:glycosyltransferase involved in cell wall biosynthesis
VGPEICGDAAVFFNPLSSDSLQQAAVRVLCDTVLRERLIERGRARAAEFSWERAASQLLAIFREAMAQ